MEFLDENETTSLWWDCEETLVAKEDTSEMERDSSEVIPISRVCFSGVEKNRNRSFTEVLYVLRDEWKFGFQTGIESFLSFCLLEDSAAASDGRKSNAVTLVRAMLPSSTSCSSWFCSFFSSHLTNVSRALELALTETQLKTSKPMSTYLSSCGSVSNRLDEGDQHASETVGGVHKSGLNKSRDSISLPAVDKNDLWRFFSTRFTLHFLMPLCFGWTINGLYFVLQNTPFLEVEKCTLSSVITQLFFLGFVEYLIEQDEKMAFQWCTERHKEDREKVFEDVRKNNHVFCGAARESNGEDARSLVEAYALELGMRLGWVSLQHFFFPAQAVMEEAGEGHLKTKKTVKVYQNDALSHKKEDNDDQRNRCRSTTTANDPFVDRDSILTRGAPTCFLSGSLLLHVFPAFWKGPLETNAQRVASFTDGFSSRKDRMGASLFSEAVRCTFPILQRVAAGWITVLLSRHLPYRLLEHSYHSTVTKKEEHGSAKEEAESSAGQPSPNREAACSLHHLSVSYASSIECLTQTGVNILQILEDVILSSHNENPLVQSSLPMVNDALFARYDGDEKLDLFCALQCIAQHYLSWLAPTRVQLPSSSHFFSCVSSMSDAVEERKGDTVARGAWWLHVAMLFLEQWVEVIATVGTQSRSQDRSLHVLESTLESTTRHRRTKSGARTRVNPDNSRMENTNVVLDDDEEEEEGVGTQESRRLPLLLCRAAIQFGHIFIDSAVPSLASFLLPYYVLLARVCYRVVKRDGWRGKEASDVAALHDGDAQHRKECPASTRLPAASMQEQSRDGMEVREEEKETKDFSSFFRSSLSGEVPCFASASTSMEEEEGHSRTSSPTSAAKLFFSDVFVDDLLFIQRRHPPSSLFCPLNEVVCASVRSFFHSSSPSTMPSSSSSVESSTSTATSASSSFGLHDPSSLLHPSRTPHHLLPLGVRFLLQPQETLKKMIQLAQECPPNAFTLSRGDDEVSSKKGASSTPTNTSHDTHGSTSTTSSYTFSRPGLPEEPILWEEEIQRTNRFTVLFTDMHGLSTSRAEAYRSSPAASSSLRTDTSRSCLEMPVSAVASPSTQESGNLCSEGPPIPPSGTQFPSLSSSQALYAAKVFHPRYVFVFSTLFDSIREVSQWVQHTVAHFRWIPKRMWTLYSPQDDEKRAPSVFSSSASDDPYAAFVWCIAQAFLKTLFSHVLGREVLHRPLPHDPAVSAVMADLLAFGALVLRAETREKDIIHASFLPWEGKPKRITAPPKIDTSEPYPQGKDVEVDVLQDVREALASRLRWKCSPPSCPHDTSMHIIHFLFQRIVVDGEYGFTFFFLPSLRAAGVDDSMVERWEDLMLVTRVSFCPTVNAKEEGDCAVGPFGEQPTSEAITVAGDECFSLVASHHACPTEGPEMEVGQPGKKQTCAAAPSALIPVDGGVEGDTSSPAAGPPGAGGTPLSSRWLSFGSVSRELVYLTQLPPAGYCSSGSPSLAEHLKEDAVQWWQYFLFDPFAAAWAEKNLDAEDGGEGRHAEDSTPKDAVDGAAGVGLAAAEATRMVKSTSEEDVTPQGSLHISKEASVASSPTVEACMLQILVEAGTIVMERMLQLCGASSIPFASAIPKVPLLSEVDLLKHFFLSWWRLCDDVVFPSAVENDSYERVRKMYQSRQCMKQVVIERVLQRCHMPPPPPSSMTSVSFGTWISSLLQRQRHPLFPSTVQAGERAEGKDGVSHTVRDPESDVSVLSPSCHAPSFLSSLPSTVPAQAYDTSSDHHRLVSWAMTIYYDDLLYDRFDRVTQTSYLTDFKGGPSALARRCYTDYRSSFSSTTPALMHIRQLLTSYEMMKKNTAPLHVNEMRHALLLDAQQQQKRLQEECDTVTPMEARENGGREEEEKEGSAEKGVKASCTDGLSSLPSSSLSSFSLSSRLSKRASTYLSELNRALRVRVLESPTEAASAAAAYREILRFTIPSPSVSASPSPSVASPPHPSPSPSIFPLHAAPQDSFWLSSALLMEYWSKLTLWVGRLLTLGKVVMTSRVVAPATSPTKVPHSIPLTLGEITAISLFLSLSLDMWKEVRQCASITTPTEGIPDETPTTHGEAVGTTPVRRKERKTLAELLVVAERRVLQEVTDGMKKFVQSERSRGDAAALLLARAFQPYLSDHKGYAEVVALAMQRVSRLANANSRWTLMALLALPIAGVPVVDETSRTKEATRIASPSLSSSVRPDANGALSPSFASSRTTHPTPSSSTTAAGGARHVPLLPAEKPTPATPPVEGGTRQQESPVGRDRLYRRQPERRPLPLPASRKEEPSAAREKRVRMDDGVKEGPSGSGRRGRSDYPERATHSTRAHTSDEPRHHSRRARVEGGQGNGTHSTPSSEHATKGKVRKESETNRHYHSHHSRRRRG